MTKQTTIVVIGSLRIKENGFASFLKMNYYKRKEFILFGSKFFLFKVDAFQKGHGVEESKQEVTKVIPLVKWQKINQVYLIPFNNLLFIYQL